MSCPLGPSLIQLLKELLWGHEEGVLLKNAANDDHGMGSYQVHHGVATELREIIDADNGIVMLAPDIIDLCFKLDQVVNARRMTVGPFHLTNNPADGICAISRASSNALERLKHTVLIEPTVGKIGLGAVAKFQLAANLCCRGVDTDSSQMLDMAIATAGAENMDCFVAAVETVLNEWQENTILFVFAIEESTDVPCLRQLGTCKWDWLR
jgi:hypothetical protein